MKKNYFLTTLFISLILGACSNDNNEDVPPIPEIPAKDLTIQLTDNNKALVNSGMGWNLMYYTFDDVMVPSGNDVTDLLDWLPCDIVSFRLSWNNR